MGGIVIFKELSKFQTVYLDSISLKRFLLRVKDTSVFNSVITYTLMRDSCLIIYQVNNDILGTTDGLFFPKTTIPPSTNEQWCFQISTIQYKIP